MLDVFITVDTELSIDSNDDPTDLAGLLRRDIDAETRDGSFGLEYQCRRLQDHSLVATFFVEPLFTYALGNYPLEQMVSTIRSHGQSLELHAHTEWLPYSQSPTLLEMPNGDNLFDFSVSEQEVILKKAIEALLKCGADEVSAFRAGNFGANNDTLSALARNGVRYDSTYNASMLGTACRIEASAPLNTHFESNGVIEIPVSVLECWPHTLRHAQLCALSFAEMRSALEQASDQGASSFVIVSHSFELVKDRRKPGRMIRPDRTVIRRFDKLLDYLDTNRSRYRTRSFRDIDASSYGSGGPIELKSTAPRVMHRNFEQAIRAVR
jgi:hypothetical protein